MKNILKCRAILILCLFIAISLIYFGFYQKNKNNLNYNINLKDIFEENTSFLQKSPEEQTLVLVSTGDVSLANEINAQSIQNNNFTWPFENITSILHEADISLINLESPLLSSCEVSNKYIYILCGSAKFISVFKQIGINVVNIANNHIIDYGVKNAIQEIDQLVRAGIQVSGIDKNAIMDVKNTKIGFLGFNDIEYNDVEGAREETSHTIILQADNIDAITSRIKKLRERSDIVVVSFHWGVEYTSTITERQKQLAHTAIDAGADLVLGNHPHWIQPIEIYKNKLIVYSHGSLVFNQKNFDEAHKASEQTKIGIIGKYSIVGKKIVGVEFIPIRNDANNQPSPAKNEDKKQILKMLEKMSYQLSK